jgi:hypothetical protein
LLCDFTSNPDILEDCDIEKIAEVNGIVIYKKLEDTKMKTRYYVCGLCYDKNDCIIDYSLDFGDFDTYKDAYELFVKLQSDHVKSFFADSPEVAKILIQLEECEETDEEINCVDVKNEWWIDNPNFEEV